jgi:hypothetical protein
MGLIGGKAKRVEGAVKSGRSGKGLPKIRNQRFLVERLVEKADRARGQRPSLGPRLRIGRYEDDGQSIALRKQLVLQIDSAHAWHLNIGDKARGVVHAAGTQEFLGRAKGRNRVAK